MSKSFPEVLLELAIDNPDICGVSCDCWGFLGPLAREFPERAVEVGIAEQNLIGISAGLAMQGKIPFAIGMNPFVTMRCFEQIRTDVAYDYWVSVIIAEARSTMITEKLVSLWRSNQKRVRKQREGVSPKGNMPSLMNYCLICTKLYKLQKVIVPLARPKNSDVG
jgi:transketolase-like protein